jgi:hypothetical protein
MIEVDWKKVYNGTMRERTPTTDIWGEKDHPAMDDWTLIEAAGPTQNSKFEQPILPIPWGTDYHDNVALTLEWLVRDHRRDQLRLKPEFLHSPTRKFWFHNEYDPGMFMHVCYPKDLLKFRMQYDSAYVEWSVLPPQEMSSRAIKMFDNCKQLLWYQWNCIGKDGFYGDGDTLDYRYECSRCYEKMPKGVRMFTVLTQSKLKDL